MSVAKLLEQAGHYVLHMNNDQYVNCGPFTSSRLYAWFPVLQIVIDVSNNDCWQLRRDQNGWHFRKNATGSFNQLRTYKSYKELDQFIAPFYGKFINDQIMSGEADA